MARGIVNVGYGSDAPTTTAGTGATADTKLLYAKSNPCRDTVYTKYLETKVYFPGTVRVITKFEIVGNAETPYKTITGKMQIHVNGSPVGTERTVTTSTMYGGMTGTIFSEDITVKKNDLVQIYMKIDNPSSVDWYAQVNNVNNSGLCIVPIPFATHIAL